MEPPNGKQRPLLSYMSTTSQQTFRQGHIGSLDLKSKVELQELLDRQERLLSNRNFIGRLPDGGAKILQFASDLRQRINVISTLEQNSSEDVCNFNETTKEEISEVTETTRPSDGHAMSCQHSLELSIQNDADDELHGIEQEFNNLAIHEGPHYAVVKKAESQPKKSKFWLHRQQAAKKQNHSPTSETMDTTIVAHKSTSNKVPMSSIPVLSAATITDPKSSALLISFEECRDLHAKQQAVVKEQQTQLATERILLKYGIGDTATDSSASATEELHPEGIYIEDDEGNHEEDTVPTDLDVNSDDDLEAVD